MWCLFLEHVLGWIYSEVPVNGGNGHVEGFLLSARMCYLRKKSQDSRRVPGKRVVVSALQVAVSRSNSVGRGESPVKESVILKRADQLLAAVDQGRHRPR